VSEVLLLARGADAAIARRVAAQVRAFGATTRIDTKALDQGRLMPSVKEALRLADAVVLLLTPADATEPWWQDALVDAVRAVDAPRIVPVLLGEHATDNLVWPIVADRSAISVPDLGDIGALLRFIKSMLEPELLVPAPPASAAPVIPQAAATAAPPVRDSLLSQALVRQQQAIGSVPAMAVAVPPRTAIDDPVALEREGGESRRGVALFESLATLEFVVQAGPVPRVMLCTRPSGRHDDSVVIADLGVPTDAVFVSQVEKVVAFAALRKERESEIVVQADERLAFWGQVVDITPDRRPRTRELLNNVIAFARLLHVRLKHAFGVPRPMEWSAQVMPLLPSPPGSSYPMGLAVEAYAVVRLLETLAGESGAAKPLIRLVAHRMSENRIVAGLNFPLDAVAGRALGLVVGDYWLARCAAVSSATGLRVDADAMAARPDFLLDDETPGSRGAGWTVPASPSLAHLWMRARSEW